VLFIRNIEEWNSITTPASLDHLLGMGIVPLLLTRVGGLVAAFGVFTILVAAGFLLPLMLVGGWGRRRSVDFGPFFAYAFALFAFSALVSAIHVPGGTFIHSAVALAPHAYVLAMEGVAAIVGWVAARRRGWDRATAVRIFSGATVAIGILAAVIGTVTVDARWNEKRDTRLAVGAALTLAGAAPDDRLMTIDAAGYKDLTGHPGVVTTNDPLATEQEIADAYRLSWLVLERDEIATTMAPVLEGKERPGWIGRPIYVVPADDGGAPRVAVYPICLSPADVRCANVAARGQPADPS
jgi:hypothetical protein